MCGRFALATEKHILEMLFDLELRWDFTPSENIAPSQEILAVRMNSSGEKEFARLVWGLLPVWAKSNSGRYRLINARAEKASEKPAFREPFSRRRILVPASGFYEWKQEEAGKKKRPYLVRMAGSEPFLIGGLWQPWRGEGKIIESCALLTTAANETVAPIHHRMPVIIGREDAAGWLDPRTNLAQLRRLTAPYPCAEMTAVQIF